MADARNILIFDTTLRDGEQSPGCSMNLPEKLEVARMLQALRVDVIEAGFPIASPGDFEAVQAIAQQIHGPIICGLARSIDKDIDRAGEALTHVKIAAVGKATTGRLREKGVTPDLVPDEARAEGLVAARAAGAGRTRAASSRQIANPWR